MGRCSVFPARSYILHDQPIPALVILTVIWVARACNSGNPITWPPLHIVGARHCPLRPRYLGPSGPLPPLTNISPFYLISLCNHKYMQGKISLSLPMKNIMKPIPIIVCGKSAHVAVGVKEGIRPAYEGELLTPDSVVLITANS